MTAKPKMTLTIAIGPGDTEPTIRCRWNAEGEDSSRLIEKAGIVLAALQRGNLSGLIFDAVVADKDQAFVDDLLTRVVYYSNMLDEMRRPEGPVVRPSQALKARKGDRYE